MMEHIRKITEKSFWKKGSGEIIGFLCVLPFIIFMLAIFISIVQVGTIREQLDYFTYQECRNHLVAGWDGSGNIGEYLEELINTTIPADAKEQLQDVKGVDLDQIDVEISLVDTTDDSENYNESDWYKGSFVCCSISLYVNAPLQFMSGIRTSTITMMLERPASEGSGYPWFDNL